MFRFVFRLLIALVLCLLTYNYFFGNEDEKAGSARIFAGGKELFVSVKDMLSSEKAKFDEGKYDQALGKIKTVLRHLDGQSAGFEEDKQQELLKLEAQRQDLEKQLKAVEGSAEGEQQAEKEKLNRDMMRLLNETEALFKQVEKEKSK